MGSENVGEVVGEVVGSEVVGAEVGDMVGSELVGEPVGDTVGSEVVGASVGDVVGDPAVGDTEGTAVGAEDDGDTDGDIVGDSVHPTQVNRHPARKHVVGFALGAWSGCGVVGFMVGVLSTIGGAVGLGALGGGSFTVSGSCPSSARAARSTNCAIACASFLVQCAWPCPSAVAAIIAVSVIRSSCRLRVRRGLVHSCRWVVIVHDRTRVLTWTRRPSTSVSIATVVRSVAANGVGKNTQASRLGCLRCSSGPNRRTMTCTASG